MSMYSPEYRPAQVRDDIYVVPALIGLRYHVSVAAKTETWYTLENCRAPACVGAREAFAVLARRTTRCSWPEIGAAARRTSHTTLLFAAKRHHKRPHAVAVEIIRKVESLPPTRAE